MTNTRASGSWPACARITAPEPPASMDERGALGPSGTGEGVAGRFQGRDNQNVVNVTLAEGFQDRVSGILDARRQVTTNSSCGLCGRRTIESLATDVAPLGATWRV